MIVSYSLYGRDRMYAEGMLENLKLLPQIYPGAKAVIFMDRMVSTIFRMQYRNFSNVEIIDGHSMLPGIHPMMWRFCVADVLPCERFIVRDCDSRLTPREKAAVDEWIGSGFAVHTMRDHPHHEEPMMGGMWGMTGKFFPSIINTLQWAAMDQTFQYGDDQRWLRDNIYRKALDEHQIISHDSFYCSRFEEAVPFPTSRNGLEFVGEKYDKNNRPIEGDREALRKVICQNQ